MMITGATSCLDAARASGGSADGVERVVQGELQACVAAAESWLGEQVKKMKEKKTLRVTTAEIPMQLNVVYQLCLPYEVP